MKHPPAPLRSFPPHLRAFGAWRGDGILGRQSRPSMPLDPNTRFGAVTSFINHKET